MRGRNLTSLTDNRSADALEAPNFKAQKISSRERLNAENGKRTTARANGVSRIRLQASMIELANSFAMND